MNSNAELLDNHPVLSLDTDLDVLPACNYCDFDDISNFLYVNKFNILIFNIRSCRRNFNDFVSQYADYFHMYDIIVLIETWLTAAFSKLFIINGFKHFDCFRANDGGGLRVHFRKSLNAKMMSTFTLISGLYEMLTIEIAFPVNKIVVCALYHPPSADHNNNRDFIDQCCSKLELLCATGVPVITCGDFNLNLFNPLRLRYINAFTDNMLELGMVPIITIPTKFSPENPITKFSLIDQVWTNIPGKVMNPFVIPCSITDHFPVSVSFDLLQTNISCFKRRVFNHGRNLIFTGLVSRISPLVIDDDFNQTFSTYFLKVFASYDEAYPIIESIENLGKNSPWITPPIKTCIKKKAKLYRMFTRGGISWEAYTWYNNKLTALLRRVKRLFYYKLFLRVGRDSSKLWVNINKILGNAGKNLMQNIQVNDRIIDGMEMVNYVNSYFVNVASNLTADLSDDEPCIIFQESNMHSFEFLPTDVNEVSLVIASLKNKGNVIYDISVRCVKNNAMVFARHIALSYNFSIEKETFPDTLKVAGVVPGHKGGSREQIDNYRPISNLPVFSKIFEKLTLTRLTSFINQFKLLSDSQYGFRKGRNISQAALRLTTMVTESYHMKMYSACFFLDLRKAFDTIDHQILMRKLYHYGFRGNMHNYIRSYFMNRKQFTQVGDYKSDEKEITKGVPQGSLLGPLLFCLYINDIAAAVKVDVVLFADDAAFFFSAPSLPQLYLSIKMLFSDLSRYLKINKLIPNLNKSKLMMFSTRKTGVLQDISFDNEVIEWVREYKYLGLILTSTLSYGPHIDKICTRVSQYTGVFYHLCKYIPRKVLKLLYNSFVLPHFILHIEMWGSAPNWHLDRIVVKQNKLLRAVLGVQVVGGIPVMPTADMYISLNVLTVKHLFKFYLFKFMVLMLKGSLPYFFDRLLRPLVSNHSYNTRSNSYRHPLLTTEIERRSVTHQLVLLHESVPPELYIDVSIKTAMGRYKKILLANQL